MALFWFLFIKLLRLYQYSRFIGVCAPYSWSKTIRQFDAENRKMPWRVIEVIGFQDWGSVCLPPIHASCLGTWNGDKEGGKKNKQTSRRWISPENGEYPPNVNITILSGASSWVFVRLESILELLPSHFKQNPQYLAHSSGLYQLLMTEGMWLVSWWNAGLGIQGDHIQLLTTSYWEHWVASLNLSFLIGEIGIVIQATTNCFRY